MMKNTHIHKKTSQSGNIFFLLFASVALIGAITVGANNTMKGIVTSMSDVTRKTIAEEKMMGAARLSIQASTVTAGGDCDADGSVEPLPFRTATGPAPSGGGWIPANIGATDKDPWGTNYGYCVWDPGTVADAAGCGGPGANRLAGSDNASDTVVAVISAGKDRKFSTTCQDVLGSGADITTGLVHHWALDEGAGTTTNDSGSGGADGTFVNTPIWSAGHVGAGALTFNGTDNFVRTTTSAVNSSQGTLAAWVYPTVATPAVIERLLMGSREPNRIYLNRGTNGNLTVRLGSGADTDSGDAVPINTWSHVAMTWGGGTYKAYLNGVEVDSGAYAGLGGISDCPSVGAYHDSCGGVSGPDGYFTGGLDDARIYDRVLTPLDITSLSSGGGSGSSITRAAGSDDIVLEYTYADAGGIGGLDLWKIKDTKPDTAIIDKSIEVGGSTQFGGALNLMGAGLILPDSTVTGPCAADTDQQLRMNFTASPPQLEICDFGGGAGLGWTPVSMANGGGGGGGEWTPPAGIVSWWKFDETTGTAVAADSIGSNDLTLTSMDANTDWVVGIQDGALDFDASNDRAEIASNPTLDLTGQLSIGFWVNFNSVTSLRTLISKHNAASDYAQFRIDRDDDELNFYYCADTNGSCALGGDQSMSTTGLNLQTGTWYHVLVSYNDATNELEIYVNGINAAANNDIGSPPTSSIFSSPTSPFRVGYFPNGWGISGSDAIMDNVMVFNQGLSGKDAMDIYRNTGGWTDPDLGGGGGGASSQLIAHWTLDETSGTAIADSSGNGNNGTFSGAAAVTSIPGKSGTALSFDGSDDRIAISNFTPPPEGTVAMWVKFDDMAENRFFGGHDDYEIMLWDATDSIQSDIGGDGGPEDNTALSPWRWYYVVTTYSATESRLYIDGTLRDTTPAGVVPPGPFTLYIGDSSSGANHDGAIDDVRIYNYAMTNESVTGLYQEAMGGSNNPSPAVALNANQYRGKISVNETHACGIKPDGSAWCWGDDTTGQLGNGATITADQVSPSRVNDASAFLQIAAGADHVCALKPDGTLWCWGDDASGQLGNGASPAQTSPFQVGTAIWTSIASGEDHSCGIQVSGAAYCWGRDADQQLGNGAGTGNQISPVAVNTASGGVWLMLSAGWQHTCGIKSDGSMWCWGTDTLGKLGDGATIAVQNVPKQVAEPGPWVHVSVGETATCGIKLDGTAWCWGANDDGQLGIGTIDALAHPVPERVADLGPWLTIDVSSQSPPETTCGIKTDGTMWCWGDDSDGKLGNGNNPTIPQALPYLVSDPGPWAEVDVGESVCAIKADGSAWCWGDDGDGKLGNGSTLTGDRDIPTRVENFPDVPPFRWTGNTVLEAAGSNNIALGTAGISYDGSSDATPLPNGLSFPASGQTRLRATAAGGSVAAGPVAWWKFDEGAGTAIADATANANNGTAVSGPTWVADRNAVAGKAMQFDNSNDYVTVPSSTSLNFTSGITVAYWFYQIAFDGDGSDYVGKMFEAAVEWQWSVQGLGSNQIGWFACYNANGACGAFDNHWYAFTTAAGFSTATWQHVVLTFDNVAKTVYIYKNGVSQTIDSTVVAGGVWNGHPGGNNVHPSATLVTSTNPVRIGWDGYAGSQTNARMDDVMIFDRAITGAEALGLYNGSYVPDVSGSGGGGGGSELKVETLNATTAAQISLKAAGAANTRSVGIDYTNAALEFGLNNAGVTNWMNAIAPQMEILPSGNVGVGTSGTAPFRLNIEGGLKIGDDADDCSAAKDGTLKYVSGGTPPWLYCNGSAWVNF